MRVDLKRSSDAHFMVRARVACCDGDVSIIRTVVVVGRDGPTEVCSERLSMSEADWRVVLPLLHRALGIEAKVGA